MQYIIIDATKKTVQLIETATFQDAKMAAGLDKGLDFGRVGPYNIAVYEFGLIELPEKHDFFSIAGQLFAGNAVIFGATETGETRSLSDSDLADIKEAAVFHDSVMDVEKAIAEGSILRPKMTVNDEVIWQWPDKSSILE